ncbi:MAG: hypothetical protein U0176_14950 [Bacteroidia bacterium]
MAGDDLHITNDGGNTWTQRALAVGFFPASMMTKLQGRLMLGNGYSQSMVLFADDCGSPWDTLDFGSNSGVFYLASDWEKSMVNLPNSYWLVTDSGNTTTSVQRPPAQDCYDDPVIFPVGDAIYATSCRDTVLLRSRDLGNTWVDCSNGMPPTDYVCYMERIGEGCSRRFRTGYSKQLKVTACGWQVILAFHPILAHFSILNMMGIAIMSAMGAAFGVRRMG